MTASTAKEEQMKENEAFRNLLWFMSGAYIGDADTFNKNVEAFHRHNRKDLTDEQHHILEEFVRMNRREKR
jgi:hypothetical protein